MLKILLALLCLLAVTGCHSDGPCDPRYAVCDTGPDPDVYRASHLVTAWTLDPALTPAEVEAVLYAAEAWTAATSGKVTMSFTVGTGELPERMVIRRARTNELEDNMLASYHAQRVVIGADVEERWLRPVLVHEMGHMLGLGHESDRSSIMFSHVHEGMPEAPTPDACEDLAFLYSW